MLATAEEGWDNLSGNLSTTSRKEKPKIMAKLAKWFLGSGIPSNAFTILQILGVGVYILSDAQKRRHCTR